MKSKLLPILLVVLILLNAFLIFMLINKTHQNKEIRTEKNFLVEQLQLSDSQKEKFVVLDQAHKEKMQLLSHEVKKQKDVLFNSFSNASFNVDSLIAITGNLEIKKELEVFNFFKSVRELCNNEQQNKFDGIINKAIRNVNPMSSKKGGNFMPSGERMPPPQK